MTDAIPPQAKAAYQDWFNGNGGFPPSLPGDPWGISAAFYAGWRAGVTCLAAELAACWAADLHLVKLVDQLKAGGDDP